MTGILKVYVREEKLVREKRSKLGNNFFFPVRTGCLRVYGRYAPSYDI